MHAETSLSIADHHAVSCTINLRKQRMKLIQTYGRNYAKPMLKLKNTNSTGHDQINLQHIKESLMVTIPYITLIINTSIVTKVYPKPWKHSIITPIHKSGDIEEPTNFRPIHLLPILSKILEKIISIQLTDYLEKHNLSNESQYAHRNNTSTEQAL